MLIEGILSGSLDSRLNKILAGSSTKIGYDPKLESGTDEKF
jgi:hypothetical protein